MRLLAILLPVLMFAVPVSAADLSMMLVNTAGRPAVNAVVMV